MKELSRGTALLEIESFGSQSQPVDLGWASLGEESVLEYLHAVGDDLPIYHESGLAPPIFGVALALGLILQRTSLPAGAIHSLQEFDTLRSIEVGGKLRTLAYLERQRERGGLKFLTFGVDMVEERKGLAAMAIKTTLLVPDAQEERREQDRGDPIQRDRGETAQVSGGDLEAVSRSVTQAQLADYSTVSGDKNPLHLDPEFAASTQFGGTIAHGMLTLAFISEMMAGSIGEAWLTSGSMRARFKGAAYPGDNLHTWAKTSKLDDSRQSYSVGLSNSATGEELITGTAAVKKN